MEHEAIFQAEASSCFINMSNNFWTIIDSLFLRSVHRNFGRPSQGIQRIYQTQKIKITQGEYLHPSCRFSIRFQVAFGTHEKPRVRAVKQFFHFLVFNQWTSKDIAKDLPYPKIDETVPKWAMEPSLRLAFPGIIKCEA